MEKLLLQDAVVAIRVMRGIEQTVVWRYQIM
jgi:hypothetical protein